MRATSLLVLGLMFGIACAGCLGDPPRAKDEADDSEPGATPAYEPHVVVATLDTGTNPFHPAFRRNETRHPSLFIPGYPADAGAVQLRLGKEYRADTKASLSELAKLKEKRFPYYVPGTNLVGLWAHPTDQIPVYQPNSTMQGGTHQHGARASSQIAGLEFSIAPDVFLAVMDRTNDQGGVSVYQSNADGLRWAADQPWIDIIHTNIQNPLPLAREQVPAQSGLHGFPAAVLYAVGKGKLVVSAGGNFFAESTETSPHAGPPGVLVAGANDNCGYTEFSNPDPHVVMDGAGTIAASANDYNTSTFGGTSSASPRISGYAAKLLLEIRKAVNQTGGMQDGALVVVADPALKPAKGPLADGRLTAAELHEVIRKTANPNPHASKFDGGAGTCVPQPANSPVAVYAKMGYGEVSEHTIQGAMDVALGRKDMPMRAEDAFYMASEQARVAFWRTLPG
ncbi:MAG: S8/S53 family peptidase [Euryarchaeota archaeon]|nr:S8/S53 family peptidase [Euryarchaeota archaeon]